MLIIIIINYIYYKYIPMTTVTTSIATIGPIITQIFNPLLVGGTMVLMVSRKKERNNTTINFKLYFITLTYLLS